MKSTPRTVLKGFFVLEGLDGAGTTTQRDHLARRLEEGGAAVMATCEPTAGPIGSLVRRILKRELTVDPRTLAMLFAADRTEHLYDPASGIVSHLEAGGVVVCDRYLFSSLAYQSVGCEFDYVFGLNEAFPLPERLIFLDVPPPETQRRLSTRSSLELFDESQLQETILFNYERGLDRLATPEMEVVHIDGTQSIEVVAEKVWSAVVSPPIERM